MDNFPHIKRLNCLAELEAHLKQLHEIWHEIGYDEEAREHREKQIKKHLLQMIESMVIEEDITKDQIVKSIEDLLKESSELSTELGVKFSVDDREYEMLPLCKVEEKLQNKVSEFRLLKQDRMSKYTLLKERENELCECLGIEEKYDIRNPVPSEEQLAKLENYVQLKEAEKAHLTSFFYQTRLHIIEIMNELDMTPFLDFEKKVVCEDETTFQLTKDNISKLKELHHQLAQKLEDTKALSMELREKLNRLYDRLYESFDARTAFLDAHSGYSIKTIDALKREINRCEERKRQNIKIFVEKIREEILDLWDKCCFGDVQRHNFIPYYSDCYTEDLLELHELEIEKLRKFYNDNKHIFQLLEKRQKLWDKMVNLEIKSHDRDRLFNRGGQLLREEKERKTIQKELPKIEEQLSKLVQSYEEETNAPFLFYDQKLSDLIEAQWNEHKENKEKEKLARKARGTESEFKQPVKRKYCPTPSSSTSKLSQITNKTNMKVSKVLFPQKSSNLQNTAASHLRSHPDIAHMQDDSIASTTYADFETGLGKI